MSETESHDGLLCKISNLHSLKGGGKKTPRGGGGGANAPAPPKKTCYGSKPVSLESFTKVVH